MGEKSLYQQFLDEIVGDINKVLALYGVCGLLEEFEIWLKNKEIIKTESE